MKKQRQIKNKKSISLDLGYLKGYNNMPYVNLDSISYAKNTYNTTKGIKLEVTKGLEIHVTVDEEGYAHIGVHNHLNVINKEQRVRIEDNNKELDSSVKTVGVESYADNCNIRVINFVKNEVA